MGRVIDVDWDELTSSSNNFGTQASDMLDIRNDLLNAIEMLDNGWLGYDADNYNKNFNEFVKNFYSEAKYLERWSNYLTKSSKNYSNHVEEDTKKLRTIEEEYEREKQTI